MKKMLGLIFMGLSVSPTLFAQTKTMYINSSKKSCTGVAPMTCLQYKNEPAENWKLLYQPIEGFNYQEGYLYTLRVKAKKVKNPPADAGNLRYILKKEVSKQKDENMVAATTRSLEGKWVIAEIMMDGKLADVSGKAWEMEFRTGESAVGVGICNRMGGGYTLDGSKIKFGPMRSTKMMCPDIKYEDAFGKAVMEVDNFSFEKNRMFLKKGNETVIVLYMPV
jgi:heat shock protein HslJ